MAVTRNYLKKTDPSDSAGDGTGVNHGLYRRCSLFKCVDYSDDVAHGLSHDGQFKVSRTVERG